MIHPDFDNRTRWRLGAVVTEHGRGRWLLELLPDATRNEHREHIPHTSKRAAQRDARETLRVPRLHWRYLNGSWEGFYLLRHELRRQPPLPGLLRLVS